MRLIAVLLLMLGIAMIYFFGLKGYTVAQLQTEIENFLSGKPTTTPTIGSSTGTTGNTNTSTAGGAQAPETQIGPIAVSGCPPSSQCKRLAFNMYWCPLCPQGGQNCNGLIKWGNGQLVGPC